MADAGLVEAVGVAADLAAAQVVGAASAGSAEAISAAGEPAAIGRHKQE